MCVCVGGGERGFRVAKRGSWARVGGAAGQLQGVCQGCPKAVHTTTGLSTCPRTCKMMMCCSRMISTAARCSLVCGCGHGSLAAISSMAPSMTAAPLSIVAMRMSWPGQSTKLTCRTSSISASSNPGIGNEARGGIGGRSRTASRWHAQHWRHGSTRLTTSCCDVFKLATRSACRLPLPTSHQFPHLAHRTWGSPPWRSRMPCSRRDGGKQDRHTCISLHSRNQA